MYSQCDGLEFERSSCRLDLRYVPDDQSFEGREVRDVATEVPSDYEPPDFQMKALQHTNVKLSWDDDDPTRTKALRRKLTEDRLKDEDFAAYMGSDSSEDEEEEEEEEGADEGAEEDGDMAGDDVDKSADGKKLAAKQKYLALLLGGGGGGDDDDDGDGGGDASEDEGFRRCLLYTSPSPRD